MVEYHVRVTGEPDGASFDNEQDAHDWVAREHPGKRYRIERIGSDGSGTGPFVEYDPR